MSRRRILAYISILVTGSLAFIGVGVFVAGIVIELQSDRAPEHLTLSELSPAVQLSLAGLCLSSLMFIFWFGLVALLIARQARERGSGYGDAYRLIEAFRFSEAIPLLERSIREGKENPDVLMLLTSAYAYTGQFGKAQATADRAVRLFPNDPGAYVTLANGYRLQAAYDEAATALREAVERAPDEPILWSELGFAQFLAGDEKTAFESFKQAATFPMPAMYGVRVHYHLAQGYEQQGDTAQAMKSMARMMSARDGLAVWRSGLSALEGTAYGQALRYEIETIEKALRDADAGNLG